MRTYFIIAALMGVFAFGSISILAHAQDADTANRIAVPASEDAMTPSAGSEEPLPEGEEPDDAAAAKEQTNRDKSECHQASYGRKGGTRDTRTPEQRKTQYEDCMSNRGYSMDEIGDGTQQ